MLHPHRYEYIVHISLGETKLLKFSNSFLHETLDAKVITAIFFEIKNLCSTKNKITHIKQK
jgi:hypothetical protein